MGRVNPLCLAAGNGDVAEVRALLSRGGVSPDVRDEEGQTPLMRIAGAHRQTIRDERQYIPRVAHACGNLLLDHGAAVNARDPGARTALLIAMGGYASEHGVTGADEGVARLLIARGADVNAQDNEGWSPLLTLVNLWADQPKLLEFLVAKGADVNARLRDGRSGLMLAARLGKDDRLALLIARGASVNARDINGGDALMTAAEVEWEEQSFAMMKLLVARGADLNAADAQGRTAADRAARAGYLERAKFLLDGGTRVASADAFWKQARNYALLRAISGGSLETASGLLDQGADPNFRDDSGRTLLTIAAADEYSAARTRLLLSHGASVNLAASSGDTALLVAADRYQPDTVKALLDHGADPKATDRDGNTALMKAAASKHSWEEDRKPLIGILLEKGADPAAKNRQGVTPLMMLALNGNPAMKLLLEKPIDVNARDEDGNTALLYASRFFVRDGPRRNGWALAPEGRFSVNVANHAGETALILAATQFEPDAARLLLQSGAAVNAKTKEGRTALMQSIDGPKDFPTTNGTACTRRRSRKLLIARRHGRECSRRLRRYRIVTWPISRGYQENGGVSAARRGARQ